MLALVTGSTGFLGSHLVARLLAAGHRARALARDLNKGRALAQLGAEVVQGDVTVPASLTAATQGIDVVFHSAALVTNWAPWSAYLATTVRGTENLLDASIRASVKRFVHISTVRVYDDRYCLRQGVVTEDAPHGPCGFRDFGYYARAKVMAEAAVWSRAAQLPVTVVRPAWIYGPGDESIVPGFVRFLCDPRSKWAGQCDPSADPIYVTDVADCAIAAAEHPDALGQAYNASPHRRTTVREFLGALSAALGVKMPESSTPYFVANFFAHLFEWCAWLARRPTAPRVNRAGLAIITRDVRHDPTKAERQLGWRSKIDLADGIALTARWIMERHPELLASAAKLAAIQGSAS